jgi:hypothetical protein
MVTAGIYDGYGNMVTTAVNVVVFSISGEGTLVGGVVKTASAGIATINMKSTINSGTAVVTAISSNLISGSAAVTTIPVANSVSCGRVYEKIPSDGVSETVITAQIRDMSGNLITGATNSVTFGIASGSGVLAGANPTQASGGIATILLRSTTAPSDIQITGISGDLLQGTTVVHSVKAKVSLSCGDDGAIIWVSEPYVSEFAYNFIDITATIIEDGGTGETLESAKAPMTMKAVSGKGRYPEEQSGVPILGKVFFYNIRFPDPGIFKIRVNAGEGITSKETELIVQLDVGVSNIVSRNNNFGDSTLVIENYSTNGNFLVETNLYDELTSTMTYKINNANDSQVAGYTIDMQVLKGSLREFKLFDPATKREINGFEFKKEVTIGLPYVDDDDDGFLDGTGITVESLKAFVLNEESNTWEKIEKSYPIRDIKQVRFESSHFSVYCLMGAMSSQIVKLNNYPNPFCPGREKKTVINYIIGNANDVKINIYTISGRLIEELDCGNEYGYAEHEWDGTDRAGGAVSTGIYIYEVSAEVNGKKIKNTGKAIVIR